MFYRSAKALTVSLSNDTENFINTFSRHLDGILLTGPPSLQTLISTQSVYNYQTEGSPPSDHQLHLDRKANLMNTLLPLGSRYKLGEVDACHRSLIICSLRLPKKWVIIIFQTTDMALKSRIFRLEMQSPFSPSFFNQSE